MFRNAINLLGGVFALARLATTGALNRRNRYWQWREMTAFGRFPVGRRDRLRALIDYGRWVHSMRWFR